MLSQWYDVRPKHDAEAAAEADDAGIHQRHGERRDRAARLHDGRRGHADQGSRASGRPLWRRSQVAKHGLRLGVTQIVVHKLFMACPLVSRDTN
jgi:hypothetical protein